MQLFNIGVPENPQRGNKDSSLTGLKGLLRKYEIQAYLQWPYIGSMPGKLRHDSLISKPCGL